MKLSTVRKAEKASSHLMSAIRLLAQVREEIKGHDENEAMLDEMIQEISDAGEGIDRFAENLEDQISDLIREENRTYVLRISKDGSRATIR